MSEYPLGSTAKVYYGIDGSEKTLRQMIRDEPEWAESRIREGEDAIKELERTERDRREAVEIALECQEATITAMNERDAYHDMAQGMSSDLTTIGEERDALAAHCAQLLSAGWRLKHELQQWSLTERGPQTSTVLAYWDAATDEKPSASLARRDVETAKAIQLALIEGANRNHLYEAPTARQAVDFLLSLARQEVEKREPVRRQAEEAP